MYSTFMKKRILAGILISIFFIFLILKNVDIKSMFNIIAEGQYLWLLPYLCSVVVAFTFRSIRWKLLFLPVKKFKSLELFPCLMMGFAANLVFPMRIGEFVRAYIVGKKHNISKSASFATIVLERIMDGVGILVLLSAALVFLPKVPPWTKRLFVSGIVFFIVALIIAGIMIVKKSYMDLLKKIPFLKDGLKEKIVQKAKKFTTGFEVIKDVNSFFMIILISVCIWICESMNMYFIVRIIGVHLPFSVMIFVLFATVIGLTIPAAPGSVGTFEFFFVEGIRFFGVSRVKGLAGALLVHSMGIIFIMSLGIYYYIKEGISYKELTEEQKE
ncbi:MAG: flippase-like domain-containing protein [Elusimicrobia bacterium]|nr:flippase-like domain-containing protein [Elusimicrobiota bacterium]